MFKNIKTVYAVMFFGLLLTEIIIALFIKDNFIRPYIGDLLVTVLICSFCRIFIPKKVVALPIYVFAFSIIVEFAQHIDIVKILGLQNIRFLSILIGRSFSMVDILCYALGCLVFFIIDKFLIKKYIG